MPDTKKDALAATICDALTWHQWQCDGAMDHREAVADAIATLLAKDAGLPESQSSAERDAAYREQAEALIADLRARLSHLTAGIEAIADEWVRQPYSSNPVQRLYDLVEAGRAAPTERWPFGAESALRLIAATGNPNERKETRDAWAGPMPGRPKGRAIEIARARARLEQAIAYVLPPVGGEQA